MTVVYALNFLDRTIFNVLIEPIKKEFALSVGIGESGGCSAAQIGRRDERWKLWAPAAVGRAHDQAGRLVVIWAARSIRVDVQRAS